MCRVVDEHSSRTHKLNPITNRAMFIINTLNELGLAYKTDIFNRGSSYSFSFDESKLCNIIVEFASENPEPAILFDAHFDIVNNRSESAQDNTASVCNLLRLCKILSKEKVKRRTIIVFTDAEEISFLGMKNIVKQIKEKKYGEIGISYVLELTGLGTQAWIDSKNTVANKIVKSVERIEEIFGKEKFIHVSTPQSNVIPMRSEGLDAVCIGILPADDLSTHPRLWNICHSSTDTYDKCSQKDMESFVEVLRQIVQGKSEPKAIETTEITETPVEDCPF
jgi:acetylornithine deacetylase/succinyl-diaminopimelate desuccinylase-like protein